VDTLDSWSISALMTGRDVAAYSNNTISTFYLVMNAFTNAHCRPQF